MYRRPLGYKDRFSLERRHRFFRKIFLLLIIFLAIVGTAVYSLVFHGLFDVRTLDIKGATKELQNKVRTSLEQKLDQQSFFIKNRANIFLISRSDLQKFIAGTFPEIETTSVERIDWHSFLITMTERKPSFIYCIEKIQKCFNTDIDGYIYDETIPSVGSIFIRINDQRDIAIEKGETIDKKELLPMFQALRDILQNKDIGVNQYIIPDVRLDEIEIQTTAGWKILLNIQTDIQKQIFYFLSYFAKSITADQKANLQYVDLRLPERIYFK